MLTNLELKCPLLKATWEFEAQTLPTARATLSHSMLTNLELEYPLLKDTLGARTPNIAYCESNFEPFNVDKFGAQVLPAEGHFGSSELKHVPLRVLL